MPNPAYLVMVTAGNNHNKFYRMTPQGATFVAEYGRIGNAGVQRRTYPISQFESKYNEKICKGYTDQTHIVADLITKEQPKQSGYKPIENADVASIVDRLQQMAHRAILDNYTISANKVTQKMVDTAQTCLSILLACQTVGDFNETLIDLFRVIPRKMGRVADYLADSKEQFAGIIQREQDLLDVMRGQVVQRQTEAEPEETHNDTAPQKTILDALGLAFAPAAADDVIKIKSCLGSCAGRFKQAWRVTNQKTQARFDAFLNGQGRSIETKLLWHGSRNENWWSIVNSGLVLRPTNAVITGKMFGYGIYFATKARKSLGYTSLSGSYWARGSSRTAFMALYLVAYGTPMDVYSFEGRFSRFNYAELQKAKPGAHCLHAHAGRMLKNDEIIVYQEEQTTIQYLVELEQLYG